MRGKETIKRNTSTVTRITPAYAGKRKSFSSIFKCSRDHPRLCGEKIFQDSGLIVLRGSPPPMRGKVLLKVRLNEMDGITPAYAGKSMRRTPRPRRFGDHPRLCGEKWLTQFLPFGQPGSPPPMRGKDKMTYAEINALRITPAYAGKRAARYNWFRFL